MWSRVKAEAEDRLADFPFKAHYNFRPAMIQPMRGVRSRTTAYRIVYGILSPFYPLMKRSRPARATASPKDSQPDMLRRSAAITLGAPEPMPPKCTMIDDPEIRPLASVNETAVCATLRL